MQLAIVGIRLNQKRPDLASVYDHIKKTKQDLNEIPIETVVSKLLNLNVIGNKKSPQCVDLFYRVNNSSGEAKLATTETTVTQCTVTKQHSSL